MLLLDENLSPRLIARVENYFPGSLHVLHAGLDNSPDQEIWDFAKRKAFAVVTKDRDFLTLLEKNGPPPKVLHLSLGNVRVSAIEKTLLENEQQIKQFLQDRDTGLLTI